jgi:primosomal protein N' (replication factor Y)
VGGHRALRVAAPKAGRIARVCRVLPDVAAIERSFDYVVPDALAAPVRVGAIVRVELHGRRVRGWVVADDVVPEVDTDRLRPLLSVSSAGPPPVVVELCSATAYRYAGATAPLLRAASPPNNVAPPPIVTRDGPAPSVQLDEPAAHHDRDWWADELARDAVTAPGCSVIRWPPLADRRRLVARLLAPQGSTLVVIADGVRAVAFASWLRSRGARVALLHSDASAADRTAAWRDAAAGRCVVVGGRMAAFAPVPDLARVVLLDDADEALQEERTPTWHAREVLAERAEADGAPMVIVSPAPTVTALVRAGPERVLDAPPAFVVEGWPRVEVVDLGALDPYNTGLLTETLVDRVRSAIDQGDLAIVVLNRRGRVRLVACRDCGTITRWDEHGRPAWAPPAPDLAYLKPEFCPSCASTKLRVVQVGVQRLARDLGSRLGHGIEVGVVDMSTDSGSAVAPVLVGTEAVLHRSEVRRRRPVLVAYAELDQELYAARYRAAEQAMWLLVRGAHLLAARPRSDTRLLVQSSLVDHDVVQAALRGSPQLASDAEQARRQRYQLPPYGALAEARGDEAAVERLARELERFDVASTGTVLLDAAREAATLLVRAPDSVALAAALSLALPTAREDGTVRVAVDPPRV